MKNIIILIVVAALLSGCLKNHTLYNYYGTSPLIINPKANFPSKDAFPSPLTDSAFGVTRLNLYAKYAFRYAADRNIKVTFTRNDTLTDLYNRTFYTNFKPLPANCFRLSSAEITIPEGATQAFIPITLIPENMNGTDDYIIAFTISDGDGITVAENYKSIVFTLKGHQ